MSTTSNPLIPPILPENEAAAANAPEPDSERAEAEKARVGKRLMKEGALPLGTAEETPEEACDPQDHA